MKSIIVIPSLICILHITYAQSISSLEPVSRHYESLQKLSNEADPNEKDLNAMRYPSSERATGKQFIGLEPTYLKQADVSELQSLTTFPANGSAQTRAELDYLLKWQEKRDAADRRRAYEIAAVGYWPPLEKNAGYGNVEDLFWECESIIGTECNPENYPATTHLLAGITRDMRIVEFSLKYHHMRPRPYHLEPKLKPMGRVSNPSYASGHTLWAYIQAFAYSELIPDKRQAFIDLAYEVGESREIMGIHYPSDEEAARVIAHRMLVMMLENEEFQKDFEKAKEEWSN